MLASRNAEWESERHNLQNDVTRLGQRAVQAETLEAQVDRQDQDLKEMKVSGILSN